MAGKIAGVHSEGYGLRLVRGKKDLAEAAREFYRTEPVVHQILAGGSSRPSDLLQATFGITATH